MKYSIPNAGGEISNISEIILSERFTRMLERLAVSLCDNITKIYKSCLFSLLTVQLTCIVCYVALNTCRMYSLFDML